MSDGRQAGAAVGEDLPGSLSSAVEAVEANKGSGLLVLDLRDVASFTDYLLICTGRSERHVQALVDAIIERLAADEVKPLHTEGYRQATWVLVDFVDFLVNVFTPETRDFYQLERVWRDAPVVLGEPVEARPEEPDGDASAPDENEPTAAEAVDG